MSYRKLIKLAARFSNKYAMGEREVFNPADILEEILDEYEIPESERDVFRENSEDFSDFDNVKEQDVREYFSALVDPSLDSEMANAIMDSILAKYDGRKDSSDEEYQDDLDTIFKGLNELYSEQMKYLLHSKVNDLSNLALELLKKGVSVEDVEEYLSYEEDVQPDLDAEEAEKAKENILNRYRINL
jgi:hypothetical protein